MRAILVTAPLIPQNEDRPFPVHPPLGPMSMAAVAREAGHDVEIIDLNLARCRGDLPSSDGWYEAAAEYILAADPDLVGFSTISSGYPATILVARSVKALRPSLPIVLGGSQATMACRSTMAAIPEVDFVLAGEADRSFSRLLDRLAGEGTAPVPGLAERRNGETVLEPPGPPVDLMSLPATDYSLWPIEEAVRREWYTSPIPIEAGRGCPYRCSFCSTSTHFQRKYRMKSPERLGGEVHRMRERFGFTRFSFVHDAFTAVRGDALALARAWAGEEMSGVTWSGSARVDNLDEELLRALFEGGCRALFLGIESGSPRMQKVIGKSLDLDRVPEIVRRGRDLGFGFTMSCIAGFPEEEWSDVEATLDLLLGWSGVDEVNLQLHLLAPQNGTRVLEEHGDRLAFDSWFPDSGYFNRLCPEREIAFVEEHPDLCTHCYYIPNERVDRGELAEFREFGVLLLHVLPGVGPFVQRTEPSLRGLIRRWRERCRRNGLPIPDGTGFFLLGSVDSTPYVRALIEELGARPRPEAVERSFVRFWTAVLDLDDPPDRPDAEPWTAALGPRSAVPAIESKSAAVFLDHEIEATIAEWSGRGVFRWPGRLASDCLIVEDGDGLRTARVPRAVAAVFRFLDGRRSLADVLALVGSLRDAETVRYREELGTPELTGHILTTLRQTVGLSIHRKTE